MKNIITNRKEVDNDTQELVDKYIDDICAEPEFLCKNRELCGTSTSIYTSVKNVNNVCKDIKQANKCENDIHNLYSKLNTISIYSLIRDNKDKPGKDTFWPQFVQNLSVGLNETPQFGQSTTSLLLFIKALKNMI
jgi:hypothetical protein